MKRHNFCAEVSHIYRDSNFCNVFCNNKDLKFESFIEFVPNFRAKKSYIKFSVITYNFWEQKERLTLIYFALLRNFHSGHKDSNNKKAANKQKQWLAKWLVVPARLAANNFFLKQ